MNPDQHQSDRAEDALRSALRAGDDPTAGPELAPARLRSTVRSRRRMTGALTAAVAAVAVFAIGFAVLPRSSGDQTGLVTALPPAGWRTEQYRFVTFTVPETWGYAYAPGSAWCASSARPAGKERPPYVSLGKPAVVPAIACQSPPPAELTSEHVEAYEPTPADPPEEASPPTGVRQENGWWIAVRVLRSPDDGAGTGTVIVKAVSRDRSLAERISTSAKVGEDLCGSTSPVQQALPPEASSSAGLTGADRVVVCQYESGTRGFPGGLRGRVVLTGTAATRLMTAVAAAPEHGPTKPCAEIADAPAFELALTLDVTAGDRRGVLYLGVRDCGSDLIGGIRDGATLRSLTRGVCRQALVPPVQLEAAGEQLARVCM